MLALAAKCIPGLGIVALVLTLTPSVGLDSAASNADSIISPTKAEEYQIHTA
jgi:hypothetical protein